MDAIRRLAPHIHMTHCKEGILYITEEGIVQQLRSVGEGIVDWEEALVILGDHFPDLSDKDVIEFERLAEPLV